MNDRERADEAERELAEARAELARAKERIGEIDLEYERSAEDSVSREEGQRARVETAERERDEARARELAVKDEFRKEWIEAEKETMALEARAEAAEAELARRATGDETTSEGYYRREWESACERLRAADFRLLVADKRKALDADDLAAAEAERDRLREALREVADICGRPGAQNLVEAQLAARAALAGSAPARAACGFTERNLICDKAPGHAGDHATWIRCNFGLDAKPFGYTPDARDNETAPRETPEAASVGAVAALTPPPAPEGAEGPALSCAACGHPPHRAGLCMALLDTVLNFGALQESSQEYCTCAAETAPPPSKCGAIGGGPNNDWACVFPAGHSGDHGVKMRYGADALVLYVPRNAETAPPPSGEESACPKDGTGAAGSPAASAPLGGSTGTSSGASDAPPASAGDKPGEAAGGGRSQAVARTAPDSRDKLADAPAASPSEPEPGAPRCANCGKEHNDHNSWDRCLVCGGTGKIASGSTGPTGAQESECSNCDPGVRLARIYDAIAESTEKATDAEILEDTRAAAPKVEDPPAPIGFADLPVCVEYSRAEYEAFRARLAALEEVAAALPKCSGKWIEGSGGHRIHRPRCGRTATYFRTDDMWSYCDEHLDPVDRDRISGYEDAPWADAVRALARLKETEK